MKPYGLSYFWAILLTIVSGIAVLEPFIWGLALTEISRGAVWPSPKSYRALTSNYPYIGWILIIYFFSSFDLSGVLSSQCGHHQCRPRDYSGSASGHESKLNRLPVSYVDQHQFGDLLGRMTGDSGSVSNALQQSLLQIVNAVFTLGLVIAMMILAERKLALVIIISMPLSYWVAKRSWLCLSLISRARPTP